MTENSGVLDKRRASTGSKEGRYYSLVEVAQKTGIPMPILLRYKREHPDRVPSEGSGSQQRFPEEAFEVLQEIQKEEAEGHDLPRRGGFGLLSLPRLRKQVRPADEEESATASATEEPTPTGADRTTEPAPPRTRAQSGAKTASAASQDGELLSLVDISNRVEIPYPTLARYASQYGDRIPHQGKGRNRRFPPEAIEVFRQIRKESKPGRPPKKKKQAAGIAAPTKAAKVPRKAETEAPARVARPAPVAGSPHAEEGQLARRIASLEESQKLLEEQIRELIAALSKPATVTIEQA